MRSRFDEQLALLHRELIAMGALCESAIALSAKALDEADDSRVGEVFDYAAEIDRKEREIEGMCMRLLLQQQPVARDLRAVSSALKMAADLARIGANSGDIAEIVSMGHITAAHDKLNTRDMALAAIKMVTDSIDAFVRSDAALARAVIGYDDVVDGHFDRIKNRLFRCLRESEGEYALDLLMIAKYFERIADHAVSIAQWVIYALTGRREG